MVVMPPLLQVLLWQSYYGPVIYQQFIGIHKISLILLYNLQVYKSFRSEFSFDSTKHKNKMNLVHFTVDSYIVIYCSSVLAQEVYTGNCQNKTCWSYQLCKLKKKTLQKSFQNIILNIVSGDISIRVKLAPVCFGLKNIIMPS